MNEIEAYYWTTPNGQKIIIMLEECELPYRIVPVNISAGEQFEPAFLRISPNNRIPAIVDRAPPGGGPAISIFESGAVLLYLAERTGKLFGDMLRSRYDVIQWLMWQMSGLGPMAGQNHHFAHYAPERIPYAIDRYIKETARLYGVLDRRLETSQFVAGNQYSVADIASYPWIRSHEKQSQSLDEFPNLLRWFVELSERRAVKRAYEIADAVNQRPTVSEESRQFLFGQGKDGSLGKPLAER